jgi:hypothetical protein
MRRLAGMLVVLALAAAGPAAAGEPAAKPAAAGVRLALDLEDGATILGVPQVDGLDVETQFGKARLKWAAIAAIEWDPDTRSVRLEMQNGDRAAGRLAIESFSLVTLFGPATIPVGQVQRLTVTSGTPVFGLTFDGKQNHVSVPDAADLDPEKAMTLECWLKTTSAASMAVAGKRTWKPDSDHGYQLYVNGGRLGVHWEDVRAQQEAGGPINDGRWHHAAITWDGKVRRLYLDGTKVAESVVPRWTPSGGEFRIGGVVGDHPNLHFDGSISQVRLSKTARYTTDTFRPQVFLNADDAAVACWNFEAGAGDTLTDSTGHGHDGKLMGESPPPWIREAPGIGTEAPKAAPTPTPVVIPEGFEPFEWGDVDF